MKKHNYKKRMALFMVNKIFVGTNHFRQKRNLLIAAGYKIGEETKVVGPIEVTSSLEVGNNCWIGKNFKCNGNGSVIIGDNCDIGPEVTFQTGGHEIGDEKRRAGRGTNYTQTVGSGTWIGGRATIIGNTTVGKACVIAGCACVANSITDNTLAGGVPAKTIREL